MKKHVGYLLFLGLILVSNSIEAAALPFRRRSDSVMNRSLFDEYLSLKSAVLPQDVMDPDKVQYSDSYKIYVLDRMSVLGSHAFTRFFNVVVAHGSFEGTGVIIAPQIRISAKHFTFKGTLNFDGVCIIVTTTPRESIKATFVGPRAPERDPERYLKIVVVSEDVWDTVSRQD